MEFCWFLRSVTFVVRLLGRFMGRDVCLWLQQSQGSRVFGETGSLLSLKLAQRRLSLRN